MIWVNLLINEEDPVYKKNKKNILEEEIYKLIFDRCNNVKQFSFRTTNQVQKALPSLIITFLLFNLHKNQNTPMKLLIIWKMFHRNCQ